VEHNEPATLVWLRGRWVARMSGRSSRSPPSLVLMAGWSFLLRMGAFSLLRHEWFVIGMLLHERPRRLLNSSWNRMDA
jgi:hypothetical protein